MNYRHARKLVVAITATALLVSAFAVTGGGAGDDLSEGRRGGKKTGYSANDPLKALDDQAVAEGRATRDWFTGEVKYKGYTAEGYVETAPVVPAQYVGYYNMLVTYLGPEQADQVAVKTIPGFTSRIRTSPIPAGQTEASAAANARAQSNLTSAANQQREISQNAARSANNGNSSAGQQAAQATAQKNKQKSQGNVGSSNGKPSSKVGNGR